MCFTIQRMNEIKQNSALECNFFCDVKKEGMDICKSRNIYFHGVFFFTWITPIKNFNIQFYILYTCSAYMCIAILDSTYDQIIFKSRYLQIFFYHFASQILKNLYPKTKTLRLLHFVISITLRCTLPVGEQRERSCIGFDIHTLFHSAHVRRKILNGWKWIMIQVIGNLAKKMSNRLDRGVILLI